MEEEIMKTVLQEILQETNAQKVRSMGLQKEVERLNDSCTRIEQKFLRQESIPFVLSDQQFDAVKGLFEENFRALQTEMINHPAVSHSPKYFSLLPLTFKMDHFPMLVNTIMKWVVILMLLIYGMCQLPRLLKGEEVSKTPFNNQKVGELGRYGTQRF
jgi:hypothetical protein